MVTRPYFDRQRIDPDPEQAPRVSRHATRPWQGLKKESSGRKIGEQVYACISETTRSRGRVTGYFYARHVSDLPDIPDIQTGPWYESPRVRVRPRIASRPGAEGREDPGV